jgi:AcrR family transcriptional regulator
MSVNIKKKVVLNRESWLTAAMDLLLELGIGSVSISKLAEKLNITRGSFYHHFSGREDLLSAMLLYWEETLTVSIRAEVEALQLSPRKSLKQLVHIIRKHEAAAYDAPFRAWGLHDPLCRSTLERVDSFRLEYIRSQFEGADFSGIDALTRAQILLFTEMSEPSFFAKMDSGLKEQLLDERLKLLMQPNHLKTTINGVRQ